MKPSVFYGIAVDDPRCQGEFITEHVHWIWGVIEAAKVIGMYFMIFFSFQMFILSMAMVGG